MKKLLALLCISFCWSCQAQHLSSISKIMVEKNGKIGLGTTTPDELLTVKGKIHTQEVIVDLEGAVAPDYVFEKYYTGVSTTKPTYTFKNLKEIEDYIKTHNHLPNVPSASKIEENGWALKQMNLILLEKIEELTLYTIEQQKQINLLNKKINQEKR